MTNEQLDAKIDALVQRVSRIANIDAVQLSAILETKFAPLHKKLDAILDKLNTKQTKEQK